MPTPYEAVSGLTVFIFWCGIGGFIFWMYLSTLQGKKLTLFSFILAALCGPIAWASYHIDKKGEEDADR